MKPLGLVGVINALAHILISTSTVVALPLPRPDDIVGGLSEEQVTSRCHGHGQHQRVFNVLLYHREPCDGDAPSTNETPRPLVLLFDRTASENEALEHESSPANTSDGEIVERRFVKPIGRFLKNLSFEDRLGLGGAIAGLLTFYPYAIASVRSHRPFYVLWEDKREFGADELFTRFFFLLLSLSQQTISTAQTLDQMRAKKKEREELERLETAAAARASAAAASSSPTGVPPQSEPQEVHGHHHEHLESHSNSKDAAKQKPVPNGKPPVPPNGKAAGPQPTGKAGAPLPVASPSGATVPTSAPSPAIAKGKREPQSIDLSFPLLLRSPNFDLKIEPWNGDGRAAAAKTARSDSLQKRNPGPVNTPAQTQALKRLIAISGLVVGIAYLPNAGMTLFNTVQAMPDPEHERVKARLAVLRAQEEKAKADAQSQAKAKVDAQSQSKAKREMPVVEDEGRLIAVLVPWSPQTDGVLLDSPGGDFVFDDDEDEETIRRLIKEYLPYDDEVGEDFLKHIEAGYKVKYDHRDAHIDDCESDKQSSFEVRNSQTGEDQAQQLEYDKRQILPNGKVHHTHIRPAPFAKGLAILTLGGALGFFADKLVKQHMSHRVAVKEAIIAQASDKELAKDIYKTGVLEHKGGLIATVAKRGLDDSSSSHDLIVWSSEEGPGGPGEAETSSTKRNDVKPPKEDLKTIVTAAESKELKYFKPKSKLTKTSAAALLNLGVLSGLVVHRWLTRDDDINKKLLPLVDAHLLHHPAPIPAPIPTTQSVKGVQPITVKARSLTLDDMPFQHSQGQDAMLKDVLEYLDNISPALGSTSMKPYAILYPATQEYGDHGEPEEVCPGERTTDPLGGSKTMEDRTMLTNDQQGGGVSERTDQNTLRGRPTVMTLSKIRHPLSDLSERNPAHSTVQGTLSKRGLSLDGDKDESRLQKRAKGNIRGVAKMVSNGFGRVGAGFGKIVDKFVDALNDKKAQALLTASFLYPAGVEVKNAIWKPGTGTEAAPETAQPTPPSPLSPHSPPSTTPTPQKTAPASTKKTRKTRTSKVTPLPATEAETEHTPLLPVMDVKNARDKEGKDPAMIKRARISGSSLKGLKKMGNLVGKGLGVLGKGFGKGQKRVVDTLNHPGVQAATTLTMFMPLAGQLGNSKPPPNPAKRSIDDHFGFMPSADRDLQFFAKESSPAKRASTYPGNGQESQPLLLPVNPPIPEQSGKVLVSPTEDSARFFTAPHEPRLEKRSEINGAVTANVAASASVTKTPDKLTGGSASTTNPKPPNPASEQQQEPQGIALTLKPKDAKPEGVKPKAKISFKTSPNNLFFSAETVMKRREITSVTVLSPLSTTSMRMVRRKRQAGRKDCEEDESLLSSNEKPLTFVKREPVNGHSKVNYSSTKDGQVEFHGQADFLGQKEDKASLPQNVEVKYHKDPAGEAVTTVTVRTKGPNSAASASANSTH